MQLKRKMTLDLDTSIIKKTKSSLHTPSELLQSPDLQMLGIGSPEMEKFILQQQNLPTPNLTNVFFPKSITEEQEVYVKGFSDALDRLKQQNQLNNTFHTNNNNNNSTSNYKYEPSTASSSGSAEDHSLLSDDDGTSNSYSEPSEHNSTVPSAPINMENQEKIKLERKRQRNRVAASKCRKRKLEKISKLEEKVTQLKRENGDLSGVMNKLREHVASLKEQIMKHVDSGCNIMVQVGGGGSQPPNGFP